MPSAAAQTAAAHPASANSANLNKKKSLASRISNQFERFKTRSSSADKSQSRSINNVHHHNHQVLNIYINKIPKNKYLLQILKEIKE